jgi:hypothetical protein
MPHRLFSLALTPPSKKIALTALCLLIGLSGCSTAASQCKQFADVTRDYQTLRDAFKADIEGSQVKASGAQSLEDVHAAATDYKAAVTSMTGQLDAMLQDLSALSITDPQLAEYREAYVITLTGSKAALGSAGDAMQMVLNAKTKEALRDTFSAYQTKGNRAYDDILSLDARESALVDEVNAYCAQPAE